MKTVVFFFIVCFGFVQCFFVCFFLFFFLFCFVFVVLFPFSKIMGNLNEGKLLHLISYYRDIIVIKNLLTNSLREVLTFLPFRTHKPANFNTQS